MIRDIVALDPVNSSGRTGSKHLPVLDFLRGIAALCVVVFHFSSRVNLGGLFWHGYLAVDFFFCLSGFVISRAYGHKLQSRELQTSNFFITRLIRFLPLVLLGNIISAVLDIFRVGNFSFAQHAEDIMVTLLISSFLLPVFWKTSLEDTLYPLNGPVWSLFFEMFANVLYSFIARTKSCFYVSALITAVSFIVLLCLSLVHGDVHLGPHADTFIGGFVRVCFSFFLGTLIAKQTLGLNNISKWIYAIALCLITMVPKIESTVLNCIYEMLMISVIFPAIIIFSARCRDNNKQSRLAIISGEISYPIYCIHYSLVRVLATGMRTLETNFMANAVLVILSCFGMAALSWIAFVFFDRPIRKKITTFTQEGTIQV